MVHLSRTVAAEITHIPIAAIAYKECCSTYHEFDYTIKGTSSCCCYMPYSLLLCFSSSISLLTLPLLICG